MRLNLSLGIPQALAQHMPSAMKIWKDAQAKRRNVPIKTEKTIVETSTPRHETAMRGNGEPSQARGRQTETAVYTASPAIPREQVTLAQKTRAEALTTGAVQEREELYGESVRLV